MKLIRRLALMLALFGAIVAFVLLLNFTAPNPTGRRYSSRMPLTTGQATINEIGLDGELVLADDLHLPRNDGPDQLQCICNSATGQQTKSCRVCIASVQMASPFRRPDFVGARFIAESKNSKNLYYDSRDLPEITDYALAAKALNLPLWVFTRVNTDVDSAFLDVVNATGGGVVKYFTVPGYVDPVDQAARPAFLVSLIATLGTGLWELASRSSLFSPRPSRSPVHPIRQAVDSVELAEKFARESKDRVRGKVG